MARMRRISAAANTVLDVVFGLIDHTIGIRNRIPVDAEALDNKRNVTESATIFIW